MFAAQFALGVLQVAFLLDVIQNPESGWVITPMDIGLFFGMIGVVTVVGSVSFGRLSDRAGRKWFVVSGGLAGTFSMYMFLVSATLPSLYAAGFVLALSMSLSGPAVQALIGDLTDRTSFGMVMGLFGAVTSSALVVSPLLSGVLYDYFGSSEYAVIIGAVVALTGAIAATLGLPGGRPTGKPKELPQQ
jgi:DHA1 family multidrug resistance protein-like MFS transporter